LKSGKVAICISGLVRTGIEAYPAFQKFFSRLDNYDVFYHTWENKWHPSWETKVSKKIQALYKPTAFLEEQPLDKFKESSFGSMLYSIMMANELKKRHEIENNFRYDLVIKTRFDLVFDEHSYFPIENIWPRSIYHIAGNVGLNHTDYENHGLNDLIFWGDSQSMDIATNVYRYYKNVALVKNIYLQAGWKLDPLDYYLSPGTLIYQRTIQRNIAHIKVQSGIKEAPWREDINHLDPLKDFEKIRNRYANQ
jgi:hypothetical protein